jgi:uncharacterized phage protein (TIGR02216 family)
VKRIAWGELMRLGLVQIGLQPSVFWDLTPAELMLLAGVEPGAGGGALTRDGLESLMARFPDGRAGSGRKGAQNGF